VRLRTPPYRGLQLATLPNLSSPRPAPPRARSLSCDDWEFFSIRTEFNTIMRFLALILLVVGGLWLLASIISDTARIQSQTRAMSEPLFVKAPVTHADEDEHAHIGAMAITDVNFRHSALIAVQ
jgi:hypothetical protein